VNKFVPLAIATIVLIGGPSLGEAPAPTAGPRYAGEKLELPATYREWVYLSTGFDMSYRPMNSPGHHMFDNVFAEPTAYKAFLATGTWPDKTQLLLEIRGAEGKGSINKTGNFQGPEVMGLEVHVKDTARFPGGWAFFAFGNGTEPATQLPVQAECYVCHRDHAAVDTTFVQFYPTLLPIATAKGTLSPNYKP
jgi:Cytochrome P460